MAGGPSIAVKVLADLKGFTAAVTGAGDHVTNTSGRMRSAFAGVTSGLNQTGVLAPFQGVLDGINTTLDVMDGKAKGIGTKLLGAGGAAAGVGAGLTAFGSKDQAAQQQLQQSIENTGGVYDDYSKSVEEAIGHQEHFGNTANETQDALRKLTDATHDPQKALDLLGEASNIAAAKHEDLSTAADQLGKVYNGNTKLLKPFGIEIDKTTGLTKDGKTAIQALADVTANQASKATDTFTGKLDGLKAKLEDSIASFGEKYGPAIQVAGVAMLGLGSAIEVLPALFGALSTAWGVLTGIEFASLAPILLIGVAVVALVAIGYELYQHWDAIWAGIKAVIGSVWDWITGHWPLLLAILTGPIGIAVKIIKDHWDDIKAAFSAAYDFVTGVWGHLTGFFGGLWDGIKSGFKGMVNGIAAVWNDTVGALSFTVPDWVPLIGGKGFSVPDIPTFAAGGIVTSPTLALIGEAGPEAVVPLDRMRGGAAMYIETAHFNDPVDVDVLSARLEFALSAGLPV